MDFCWNDEESMLCINILNNCAYYSSKYLCIMWIFLLSLYSYLQHKYIIELFSETVNLYRVQKNFTLNFSISLFKIRYCYYNSSRGFRPIRFEGDTIWAFFLLTANRTKRSQRSEAHFSIPFRAASRGCMWLSLCAERLW